MCTYVKERRISYSVIPDLRKVQHLFDLTDCVVTFVFKGEKRLEMAPCC